MDQASQFVDYAVSLLKTYGPNLVLAVITLIVGLWLIGLFMAAVKKTMMGRDVDETLQGFLLSAGSMTLKVLLVISVAGMIGIEMTSFIAVLGAAGLAVGMALSGTLQNFAGGVMILLFRPYKVGDFIEAQGFLGSVKEIQIFNTILKTPDNKTIIIPNAQLSSGSLVNYSTEPTRRVDFTFGIGYNDDLDKAKTIIRSILANDSRAHTDPEPFIALSELADSSVNIVVRVWAQSENYWGLYFDTLEAVKKEFDRQGISIPFPQQDVYLHQAGELSKAVNA